MESNSNSFTLNKRTAEEYAQLGLGIHKSSDLVNEERHKIKESWVEIMKKMDTD